MPVNRTRRRGRISSVAISITAIFICQAQAAVLTWDGSTGNWDSDASWLATGVEPTSADDVVINSGVIDITLIGEEAGLITIGAAGTLNLAGGSLNATGGLDNSQGGSFAHTDGTLIVTGGTFTPNTSGPNNYIINGTDPANHTGLFPSIPHLILGTGSTTSNIVALITGDTNRGFLTIRDGGSASNFLGSIGVSAGSNGSVTVTDAGSTWINSGDLEIGIAGTGSLNIKSGGSASNRNAVISKTSGSTGTVTVTDNGSTWINSGDLEIGNSSSGSLNVRSGGSVSNDYAVIGNNFGSSGIVNITDAGSTWINSGDLEIGNAGTGSLNIRSGGSVSNNFGLIGDHAGSTGTVTVTGLGSSWSNTGLLYVGDSGNGTLNIEAGGSVSNIIGSIGVSPGSTGTATVTGIGSFWSNSGLLYVGDSGNGTLNIESRGSVSNIIGSIGVSPGSTGTATVTGSGSTWINTSDLRVGDAGTGTLSIENGGSVINRIGYIGRLANSSGTVAVTGLGSTWTNTFDLWVGNDGIGSLAINSDASVHVGDAAQVGARAGWLTIADRHPSGLVGGHLYILNGSTLTHDNIASLGYEAGEYGFATVAGVGSTWTNALDLIVGGGGVGTLIIEDSGTVTSKGGAIGAASQINSTATVTGTGSTWTNSDILFLGFAGSGTLKIQAGGRVIGTDSVIGTFFGSIGTANVAGIGSTWNHSSDLTVGSAGSGTLNIEADGSVTNTTGSISASLDSTGTVTVTNAGSMWTNNGGLYVGGTLSAAGGTGSLNVLDNGQVYVAGNPLKIWNTGTATLDGGIIIADTIDHTESGTFVFLDGTLSVESFLGTLNQDGGTLAPGDSPGITTISADYNLNNGEIDIELGGLIPGTEYDQVSVTGALNLGPTSVLDIALINGFVPEAGNTFNVLNWGNITGVFDHYRLPTLTGDLGWDTNNLLIDGTLSVVSTTPLPGDLDGDGFVGINDLNIVLANWNQNVPPADPLADPSSDGFVGIDDLNTVLGNWNAGTPPNSTSNIPEPTALTLLTLSVMTLSRRRSR